MDFGICRAAKDPLVGSFRTGDSLATFDEMGQALSRHCDAISLHLH